MQKSISPLLLALAMSLSIVSIALASDTGNITILRLAPWSGGTQVQIPSNVTCSTTTTNMLVIPNGGPDTVAGRNFALATAALLAGRKVNINWVCSGTTPTVVSVRLN